MNKRPPVPPRCPFPTSSSAGSSATGRMPSATPRPKPCSTAASRPACSRRSMSASRAPASSFRSAPGAARRRCSGIAISASRSRPIAYSLYRRPNPEARGPRRRDHRHVREAAGRGRLSECLVPARPAGPPLDQPARPPRTLLRRPPDRRRPSPTTRRRASASCSTSCAAMPTT